MLFLMMHYELYCTNRWVWTYQAGRPTDWLSRSTTSCFRTAFLKPWFTQWRQVTKCSLLWFRHLTFIDAGLLHETLFCFPLSPFYSVLSQNITLAVYRKITSDLLWWKNIKNRCRVREHSARKVGKCLKSSWIWLDVMK